MGKQRTRMVALLATFVLVAGCATMSDVLKAKAAGEGTTKVYPVSTDQAWKIAVAIFRWEGFDAIEQHRDEGYMLTESGMNIVVGARMGAWVEPIDQDHTKVTVITALGVASNPAMALLETTYHRSFADAVEIVTAGKPLPSLPPEPAAE